MKKSTIRIGADIGGTFTDVVVETGNAQFSSKVLTTHAAPEEGIVAGVLQVCRRANIPASSIDQVIHGTTLATNALIERSGAKTALITTAGFRDVIEMRTESRFEQYDLNLQLPKPLLERQHRFTLAERMAASGAVLVEPVAKDVDALIEQIARGGYDSVAVGFLHSYVNSEHEQLVGAALAAALPNVAVSLSCDVSPQMREYERFNTTVANAYIKPLMQSYLQRLEGRLRTEGVQAPVYLIHSGGGIMSLQDATRYPVRLVESGPAGGAVFAAHIATQYALDRVLSFDMGGTTAKICLIRDQTPDTSRVFEVARSYRFKKGSGMPISIPVIDMVEIGAGGGSLASVDELAQIRVGPESAGSEPGPACYARGGKKAAVTDADLLLGKLAPMNFAGGSIQLDAQAATDALHASVAGPLEMDTVAAAFGVAEVVDENMANAARVHAVENGEDLTRYTMIAFGGAAPLHAGRLCEKLGIERCLVPPGAGVGSAIGFLRAPYSFEASRSVYMRLSEFDTATVGTVLLELEQEATAFVRNCASSEQIHCRYKAYMRYSGQGWELPIAFTASEAASPTAIDFRSRFESSYQILFGRTVDGMDIEVTGWSVTAATTSNPAHVSDTCSAGDFIESVERRPLFDFSSKEMHDAGVTERSTLRPGQAVAGPAIITEDETTVVVPANCTCVAQPDGCLDLGWPTR